MAKLSTCVTLKRWDNEATRASPAEEQAAAEATDGAAADMEAAAAAAVAVPEAASASASGTANEDDVMQGSFLPCYDVVNATVMSMKYF